MSRLNYELKDKSINANKRYGQADKIDFVIFVFKYYKALNLLVEMPELIDKTHADKLAIMDERQYFYGLVRNILNEGSSYKNALRYIYEREPEVIADFRHELYLRYR